MCIRDSPCTVIHAGMTRSLFEGGGSGSAMARDVDPALGRPGHALILLVHALTLRLIFRVTP